MADIFISYKREEQALARQLADCLEAEGWTVWWDVKLRAGERYEKVIEDALEDSRLVIVLWSPLSVASEFILAEAGLARDEGKLVPVLIDRVKLPLRFRGLHTLDLVGWDGDTSLPAYGQLLAQITSLIGPPESKPASPVSRPQPEVPSEPAAISGESGDLLAELDDIDTPHSRRLEIGDRLAKIGDPRPGVGVDANGVPQIEWCQVPWGGVALENDVSSFETIMVGKARLRFEVDDGYIAKHPVTRAQFRAFQEDRNGYRNKGWWKDLERAPPEMQPKEGSNRPATYVSWYDAIAFCRWLSKRLGYEVTLPTEWQWQQAATGGEAGRDYPWGADWDDRRANTGGSALNRDTAVGLYLSGASLVGALDMAGNVWEWCSNKYEKPDDTTIDTSGHRRVLRGGSWGLDPGGVRCAFRGDWTPRHRIDGRGFRLWCLSPIIED